MSLRLAGLVSAADFSDVRLPAPSPLRGRLFACDLTANGRPDLLYGHADGSLTAVLR